jgi:putative peptidoglycan lipid II flippase
MVVGVLAGGLLQIFFQTPKFHKLGYSYKPNFRFNNPDFKKILRNWLPVVATASIFTINQQVAVRFATGLETGSASALSYALVFFQLPFGIFSASVTTVLFPRMSKQAGSRDTEGLKESIQYGIRFLIVTLVPSAFLLSILGREIISVAMFRGQFTLEDTNRTASVLTGYCIGLLSVGAFTFLQRYFYSVHNYRIPFIFSVVVAAVDIGLSLWLKNTVLRVVGLAVANTIAFSLGFVVLLILAGKRLNGLEGKKILLTLLKVCISTIPVIMFVYIFKYLTGDWWESGSSIGGLFILLAEAVPGIGILFAMYLLLRVEIFTDFIVKGRKRIGSK